MTAHTRTRQTGITAYYLGRPAAFWLAALAPQPAAHKPSRSSCASESALPVPEQHPQD
jgi:hypothetical protein